MKKLVSLSLILINCILFGQSNEISKYSISAKFGKTFPIQGSYLKDNWSGGAYIGLDFIKNSNLFDFIAGCDYEQLSLAEDKVKIITPHLGILHNFNKGKFNIAPSVNLGYSWLNYTYGKGVNSVPQTDVQEYHQNGFSAALELKLSYDITDNLQIGIGDSYMNIFESFGATEPKPDDSRVMGLNRLYISLLLKI